MGLLVELQVERRQRAPGRVVSKVRAFGDKKTLEIRVCVVYFKREPRRGWRSVRGGIGNGFDE